MYLYSKQGELCQIRVEQRMDEQRTEQQCKKKCKTCFFSLALDLSFQVGVLSSGSRLRFGLGLGLGLNFLGIRSRYWCVGSSGDWRFLCFV